MFKKKCIPFFLLCLVAMPMFFCVYTIIEKKIIEHRMEAKLETGDLQEITVDASSVIWLKKDKEILLNGEHFDVKTFTKTGNKIFWSVFSNIRNFGNRKCKNQSRKQQLQINLRKLFHRKWT